MNHYELARRAHEGVSFSPERRAEMYVGELTRTTGNSLQTRYGVDATLSAQVVADEMKRIERIWCAWMGAKSRCLSSMICGPANFPVRKAEKANRSEHKRGQEYSQAVNYAYKRMHTRMGCPREDGNIRVGEEGSAEKLRKEVEKMEAQRESMKAANAAIRKHKGGEGCIKALADIGLSSDTIREILNPPQGYRKGYASFSLTNLGARIKRLKDQATVADRLAETKEAFGWDGEVSAKVEDARVWLTFPGKPDDDTRNNLRRNAFKWSPSRGAWVRQDTPNARRAAYAFKPAA